MPAVQADVLQDGVCNGVALGWQVGRLNSPPDVLERLQIQVSVTHLGPIVQAAAIDPPNTAALVEQGVDAFAQDASVQLTAADFRVGKA